MFWFFVGVPKDLSYPLVRNALASVTGVKSVHSLHIWSLTIDRNSAAVHLAIGIKISTQTSPILEFGIRVTFRIRLGLGSGLIGLGSGSIELGLGLC